MRTILYDPPEIEYLRGHAYPKVSPKRTHARVQLAIARLLEDCAGNRGEAGTEWRFRLGRADRSKTEFVPDVAFVSYERLRSLPESQRDEPPFSPDIAIEVRSPSERKAFLAEKIRAYLRAGSVLVLDVDPSRRMISAHSADGVSHYEAGAAFEHAAVPWLRFAVDAVFAGLEIPG